MKNIFLGQPNKSGEKKTIRRIKTAHTHTHYKLYHHCETFFFFETKRRIMLASDIQPYQWCSSDSKKKIEFKMETDVGLNNKIWMRKSWRETKKSTWKLFNKPLHFMRNFLLYTDAIACMIVALSFWVRFCFGCMFYYKYFCCFFFFLFMQNAIEIHFSQTFFFMLLCRCGLYLNSNISSRSANKFFFFTLQTVTKLQRTSWIYSFWHNYLNFWHLSWSQCCFFVVFSAENLLPAIRKWKQYFITSNWLNLSYSCNESPIKCRSGTLICLNKFDSA